MSEFKSHWVPHSYGLVPHLSKKKKSLVNYHLGVLAIEKGALNYSRQQQLFKFSKVIELILINKLCRDGAEISLFFFSFFKYILLYLINKILRKLLACIYKFNF